MRTVPAYYVNNETKVLAMQPRDLRRYDIVLKTAEALWQMEWRKLGSKDSGTCCGGIEAWCVGKGKRVAKMRNIVNCSWVQGNLSASESVGPALKYLRKNGIECRYNDGWMD